MSSERTERVWTVLDLLRWTTDHFASRGIDTPRLDAEVLLAYALECDRLRLYVEYEKPVEEPERARFRALVQRRADERIPVALLTGTREFWSLSFEVTPDVLVPRPETETLVTAALERLPDAEAELRVLDVGTGSGAVALALATERPKARVVATDLSAAALAVAGRNAERLGLADRVAFAEGDLFEPLAGERFDLVISNPPYIGRGEADSLAPELRHEPESALYAGADGLEVLRRLVAEASDHLEAGGVLALEIDPRQAPALLQLCTDAGLRDVRVHRDLAGRERAVSALAGGEA
ncbi:MAG: peptide chain release factor N(5)-glutamine methyltransferase [Deltaproteobacteria bacterium]|nr:peptide chain release factor N(5)-glutamine methyltransferase [Deltaproteobacteria bacterium]MBW2371125.1 peptide chain release factor N(5)-glutamine methyltransferase [Deltaproteobacteria bacterium]